MIPPSDADASVGIECYVSRGPPCEARAKSTPEDFVVEEKIDIGEVVEEEKPGYYPLYRVEKGSIDTIHMADELAEALRSRVTYGGMKDKRATATQFATPTSLRSERPAQVVRERFMAKLVGYVAEPIRRGAVRGNTFSLTLRGCCAQIGSRIEEVVQLGAERKLPNFYGLQRFGVRGAGTHRVGKSLVNRDFEGAVRLMLLAERPSDDEQTKAAREAMAAGRYGEGSRLLPERKDVERRLAREMESHPGEYLRALRSVPIKLRRLYVQAYQSFLFNRTLSRALAEGEDISKMMTGDNWAEASPDGLVTAPPRGVRDPPTERGVPMVQVVGYAFRDYGSRFDGHLKAVLQAEEVEPASFYVKEMQEVSSEGGFRRPHMAVLDPSWGVDGDVANVKFTLGRGQYATVMLREVLKPRDPAASGLA